MKKRNLFVIAAFTLTSCLMVIDVTLKESVGTNAPPTGILLPMFVTATNMYVESMISNEGRDAFGNLIDVEELRIEYTLSNLASTPITVSVAISTNHNPYNAPGQTVVYFDAAYIHDPNQTEFVINDIRLEGHTSTNATYVSSSVNPTVINAFVYSQTFTVILQTLMEGTPLTFVSNNVSMNGFLSLRVSKEISDMPNVVSLFQ